MKTHVRIPVGVLERAAECCDEASDSWHEAARYETTDDDTQYAKRAEGAGRLARELYAAACSGVWQEAER